jgi:hypothetical protein
MPVAIVMLSMEPVAVAKAKRLGRELSVKVELSSGGSIGSVHLLDCEEEYIFSWPSMQLLAPLTPSCPVAFKGKRIVLPVSAACASSEWLCGIEGGHCQDDMMTLTRTVN